MHSILRRSEACRAQMHSSRILNLNALPLIQRNLVVLPYFKSLFSFKCSLPRIPERLQRWLAAC